MKYPKVRLRRLRENPKLRHLLSEHTLLLKDLVQPLFVKEGLKNSIEIPSMPGQFQWSEAGIVAEAKKLEALGVSSIILFGIPAKKDLSGHAALAAGGVLQKTIRAIKKKAPKLLVIADVCLCEYLSHGHCGVVTEARRTQNAVRSTKKWRIDNDETLKVLAKLAVSYAEAGADVIAPSDMMDGRVAAIRAALDQKDFKDTPIISYAVKYASSFYSPFREAAESAPSFGDRASYQMNPANAKEALREAQTDLEEGADMILVKPALAFGDIIYQIKNKFSCPVGAYSVSGEYAMIKAAAKNAWVDEKRLVIETHLSMKRAGADFIFTYWAKDLAQWAFSSKRIV